MYLNLDEVWRANMTTTLLLIDDDLDLGETLRYMSTKRGFMVEVVSDAIPVL